MAVRHFLSLLDFTPDELRALIARAIELKALQQQHACGEPLKNRVLGMVFEKSSTRTRVSFEAAMAQFGGHAIFLSPRDTQLGRGEPIEDTARVLSRMVDAIMVRTFEHEKIERLAAHSRVPVINGLTDLVHPCQLLADMQTWFERHGDTCATPTSMPHASSISRCASPVPRATIPIPGCWRRPVGAWS
jgi:ornithine carbamoyltransferase